MSIKENLDNDSMFDQGKIKTFVKPKKNLYFGKHYIGIKNGKDKIVTIGQIVTRWGYNYHELINLMERKTGNGRIGVVQFNDMNDSLKKNMKVQKYLIFVILNPNTDKAVIEGTIVFQNGNISFHT